MEMLALEIRPNPTSCVLFTNFHRPPNADESFLVHFKKFLAKYSVTGLSNLIVTGDFNFPHVNWNTCCPTRSDVGTEDFLLQLNLNPTHHSTNVVSPGNILDLVPTNNESFVKEVTVHSYTFDSDHHPVTFGLNIKAKRPNNVQRRVYCYKKADHKGLKDTLQILNLY